MDLTQCGRNVNDEFGFVKRSATASSAAASLRVVSSSSGDPAVLVSDDPAAPPSKRRRFNCDWTKRRAWLKHDTDNNVMFCRRCASIKLESVKKHELSAQHKRHSEAVQRARAMYVCMYIHVC